MSRVNSCDRCVFAAKLGTSVPASFADQYAIVHEIFGVVVVSS
jgi:hypothetical protein